MHRHQGTCRPLEQFLIVAKLYRRFIVKLTVCDAETNRYTKVSRPSLTPNQIVIPNRINTNSSITSLDPNLQANRVQYLGTI